jgi:hypothetical protein
VAEINHDFVRIVEAQGRQPVGIPVLLFTDATLEATGDGPPQLVARAAEQLGFDLAEIELFSTEAYLVQSVAGSLATGDDAGGEDDDDNGGGVVAGADTGDGAS